MVSRADKDSTGCISEDDFLEAFDWLMSQGQDEQDYMAIFNMLVRGMATTLEVVLSLSVVWHVGQSRARWCRVFPGRIINLRLCRIDIFSRFPPNFRNPRTRTM